MTGRLNPAKLFCTAVLMLVAGFAHAAELRELLYDKSTSPELKAAIAVLRDPATPKVPYAQLERRSDIFVRIAPRKVVIGPDGKLLDSAILGTKPFVFVTTPESVQGKSLLDIYLDIGYEAEDIIAWQRDQDMVAIVYRFPPAVTVSEVRDGALPQDWQTHVYSPTWANAFVLFDRLAAAATVEPERKGEFAPWQTFFRSEAEKTFVLDFPAVARQRVAGTPYARLAALGGDDWKYRSLLETKLSLFEHFRGTGRTQNELEDRDGSKPDTGVLEFVGPNQKLPSLPELAVVHLGGLTLRDSYLPSGVGVWVAASGGAVPFGAIVGGHEAAPGNEPLYICRATHNGGVHPGKLRAAFKGCNIGWGGRETVVADYEVLVR
ncbi:MAG: DUF3421 domain-containing protein [Proteobacteria bacterium]|nr:DUF3421 domain-containing protein [Pseudomonadota bacterium]HNK30661.1 DUF3421 domain-containing protein [Plasticicumulans sp.]